MSCLGFKHRETSANYPGRVISILSSAIFFYSSEQRFCLFPKQFVPCAHSHAEITVLAGLGVWLEIADVVNVQGGGWELLEQAEHPNGRNKLLPVCFQLRWKCRKEDETGGGYSKDVLLQILQKVLSDTLPYLLLGLPLISVL